MVLRPSKPAEVTCTRKWDSPLEPACPWRMAAWPACCDDSSMIASLHDTVMSYALMRTIIDASIAIAVHELQPACAAAD